MQNTLFFLVSMTFKKMTAQLIDGKLIAANTRQIIAERVKSRIKRDWLLQVLAVILIGNNPASSVYVRNKVNACNEIGFLSKI